MIGPEVKGLVIQPKIKTRTHGETTDCVTAVKRRTTNDGGLTNRSRRRQERKDGRKEEKRRSTNTTRMTVNTDPLIETIPARTVYYQHPDCYFYCRIKRGTAKRKKERKKETE
jgi:hypothetical protein